MRMGQPQPGDLRRMVQRCMCVLLCVLRSMNDTALTQRGGGLFTEGRWRIQSTAEILALHTHIKDSRLGARSRCFCCLDPIPPTEGGGDKRHPSVNLVERLRDLLSKRIHTT